MQNQQTPQEPTTPVVQINNQNLHEYIDEDGNIVFPESASFEGDLFCDGKLTCEGSVNVSGSLDLSGSNITTLPKGLSVGGSLIIDKTQEITIPDSAVIVGGIVRV